MNKHTILFKYKAIDITQKTILFKYKTNRYKHNNKYRMMIKISKRFKA
jgi:hypothetical protein